jgi:glucosylceramidase
VKVYTTAKDTKFKLSETETLKFEPHGQPFETEACVFVDLPKTFQSFLGIGAALTDASAETFYKLPKDKQKQLLQDFYDPEKGLGYTLARTNIQSCDFSSGSYSYVKEGDAAL